MNRWKLAVPVVASLASLFAAGCAHEERVVVRQGAQQEVSEAPPQEVYVNAMPPAEQVEVIPQAPGTEHIWIKGHWHWNGNQWTWRPGRYEARRVGYRWIPAHYEQRGNRFIYVGGYWGR
jgi:hypothetical protein